MYELIAVTFFIGVVILFELSNWASYILGGIVASIILFNTINNNCDKNYISYKMVHDMNITIDKPEYRIWLEKQKMRNTKR